MYYYKNVLMLPGVYFLNPNFGASNDNRGMQGAPIFGSIPNFDVLRIDQNSERMLVMPGFRVEVWGGFNYTGTDYADINNLNGTKIKFGYGLSNGSSCKVYYKDSNGIVTELVDMYSDTGN